MELHAEGIKEVRTVEEDKDANELIEKGWLLLATGTRHRDQLGYQAKTYFTLGKMEGEEKS